MQHPRLALNLIGFTPGGAFGPGFGLDLAGCLDFVVEAGFAHFGLLDTFLDTYGRDEAVALVAGHPAGLAYVIHPNMFTMHEPARWDAERARLRRNVDAVADMGGTLLYGTTGPAGSSTFEVAAAAFATAVGPVLAHAADQGVEILVETTNPLRQDINIVSTLRDLRLFADLTGVGSCPDMVHCWREPDLLATIATLVPTTRMVQLSDWRPGITSMPNRLVPGDGEVPLESVIAGFEAAGYRGLYDLELLGPEIDREGLEAFRRAGRQVSAVLDGLAGDVTVAR